MNLGAKIHAWKWNIGYQWWMTSVWDSANTWATKLFPTTNNNITPNMHVHTTKWFINCESLKYFAIHHLMQIAIPFFFFFLWLRYTRTQWIINPRCHPPPRTYKERRCQLNLSSLARKFTFLAESIIIPEIAEFFSCLTYAKACSVHVICYHTYPSNTALFPL